MSNDNNKEELLGKLGHQLLVLATSTNGLQPHDIAAALDRFNQEHEASINWDDAAFMIDRLLALTASASPFDSWIPQKYQFLKTLAKGATAEVSLAEDRETGQQVAIKLINPNESLPRVKQESQILKSLHSSYIVTLLDTYFNESPAGQARAAIVMEYVEGNYLNEIIHQNEGRPHPIEEATRWMIQASLGLRDAHKQRIIHRDIKPANLVVDAKNRSVKLLDFGLASNLDRSGTLTQKGEFLGTPHYISPEQSRDPTNLDPRNDVYSFGATFYHLLTGTTPFEGDFIDIIGHHRHSLLESPLARNPNLPKRINGIIEKCMAKQARDRFTSFDAILEELTPEPLQSPPAIPMESASSAGAVFEEADLQSEMSSLRHSKFRKEPATGRLEKQIHLQGGRSIEVFHGDLMDNGDGFEVIVVCDDSQLSMGGGTAKRILEAAGIEYFQQTRQLAPAMPGRVVTSSAGNLRQRSIFHAITMSRQPEQSRALTPTPDLIRSLLDSCFYHAESLGVSTIALPLLGSGYAGMDTQVCYDTMIEHISRELDFGLTPIRTVRIVLQHEVIL